MKSVCRLHFRDYVWLGRPAHWMILIAIILLPSLAWNTDDVGAVAFKAKCAMCHGADGSGKTTMGTKLSIPSLASPEVQKKPDSALIESITKGKNKMPEFGTKLKAAEITQLKDHVRRLRTEH